MSEASCSVTVPICPAHDGETGARFENPSQAFANGLMLALPLWGLIGAAIWSLV